MIKGTAIPTRRVVRGVLIAVIVITALTTAGLLITHRSEPPNATPQGKKNTASLSLDKMRHTASRQGVDEWSVAAETVNLFNTENRAVFETLSAQYFEKSGTVTHMTANQGTLDTQTRDMVVTGDVVVRREALTVTSDALSYMKESHTIISESPVVISDGISILTGDTMHLDLNAGILELDGNVTGTLRQESKGKIDEPSLH